MFRTLTAFAALPLTLGFYNSFEEGADLTVIADNISSVVNYESASPFDLGNGRTFGDALDSNLFSYTGEDF